MYGWPVSCGSLSANSYSTQGVFHCSNNGETAKKGETNNGKLAR